MTWSAHHGRTVLLVGALLTNCGRERHEEAPPAAPVSAAKPFKAEVAPGATDSGVADVSLPSVTKGRADAFSERITERETLVRELEEEGIRDSAVLRAMRAVPRHAFVLPRFRSLAYDDRPLPIVGDQTISQPYIVAFMTEAAQPSGSSRCLEIGTGSGYQAAVLAEICKRTYSIEYLPEVARFGGRNLRELGYGSDRVVLRVGDGYGGWPEVAPFDVILVTAAPEHVPEPLLHQLALGGRLVIPIGASDDVQELQRWTRTRAGNQAAAFRTEVLLPVRFVPFAGTRSTRR